MFKLRSKQRQINVQIRSKQRQIIVRITFNVAVLQGRAFKQKMIKWRQKNIFCFHNSFLYYIFYNLKHWEKFKGLKKRKKTW